MARPGQDPTAKDDVPWWLRYSARSLGTVGGFCMFYSYFLKIRGVNLLFSSGYFLGRL